MRRKIRRQSLRWLHRGSKKKIFTRYRCGLVWSLGLNEKPCSAKSCRTEQMITSLLKNLFIHSAVPAEFTASEETVAKMSFLIQMQSRG